MARSPFVIKFTNDLRPTTVDHSQSTPGPDGERYNRAGYTTSKVVPQMKITWKEGDTALEAYVEKALIHFRLKDFVVRISSDYAEGSCAYKATLEHEMTAHVDDPIRIFHQFRSLMEAFVDDIDLPSKQHPISAKSLVQLEKLQEAAVEPVAAAILDVKTSLVQRLRLASARHDTGDEYKLVYGQCKAADWRGGK